MDFVAEFLGHCKKMDLLDEKKRKDLLKEFGNRSKDGFINFLLDEAYLSKHDVLTILSLVYKVPSFDTVGAFFNHDFIQQFPVDFMRSNSIIPYDEENDIMVVIAADPDQSGLVSRISEYTDAVIEFNVGLKRDIWDAIREFSDSSLTAETEDNNFDEEEEFLDQDLVDDNLL